MKGRGAQLLHSLDGTKNHSFVTAGIDSLLINNVHDDAKVSSDLFIRSAGVKKSSLLHRVS